MAVLAVGALAQASLHETSARRAEVRGVWEGTGEQTSGDRWTMRVTIESERPGRCARVEYPSLECGGYWTCSDGTRGSLRGKESITYGKDTCIDGGEFRVRVEAGHRQLRFDWTGGGQDAWGVLRRIE